MKFATLAITALPLLALAACGEDATPADDEADVAQVRAIHDNPPPVPVDPEHISYNVIEKNNLFGASCGFAPANSLRVIALAQADNGYLKLKGELIHLSPDKGGAKLPMNAWQNYSGEKYSFELMQVGEDGEQSGVESTSWPGSLTITDAKDKVVYQSEGTLQCGA